MDNDELKGKGEQVAGKVREQAGKLTGNEEQEAKGRADQMKGKARETVGDVKAKARELADKVTD